MGLEKLPAFNKELPFGVIYGDPNLAYEQGGVHYKIDGTPVENWASQEQLSNETLLRNKRVAKEKAAAVRRSQAEVRRKLLEAAE